MEEDCGGGQGLTKGCGAKGGGGGGGEEASYVHQIQ
jgi:hypothetical protein